MFAIHDNSGQSSYYLMRRGLIWLAIAEDMQFLVLQYNYPQVPLGIPLLKVAMQPMKSSNTYINVHQPPLIISSMSVGMYACSK